MKIIKIGAIWCSACLIVNSRFLELKGTHPDIEFLEYDVDFDDITKYNVKTNIPVIIAEVNGEEIGRLMGEVSKDQIEDLIKKGKE